MVSTEDTGYVSDFYGDIYDKVKNGEVMTEDERMLYAHEYI